MLKSISKIMHFIEHTKIANNLEKSIYRIICQFLASRRSHTTDLPIDHLRQIQTMWVDFGRFRKEVIVVYFLKSSEIV